MICQLCPRLADHRQKIAQEKRKSFRHWTYWGKPVPSFGQWNAKLPILGLAPAVHGANRTGRMFTRDRSGDFLYDSLHRFGFCNQPSSQDRNDGLKLSDTFISAALHCAPPTNKPTPEELENCRPHLLKGNYCFLSSPSAKHSDRKINQENVRQYLQRSTPTHQCPVKKIKKIN